MIIEYQLTSWLAIFFITLLAGITSHFNSSRKLKATPGSHRVLANISLSLFTGTLGGTLCFDLLFSIEKSVFICGLCSFVCHVLFRHLSTKSS